MAASEIYRHSRVVVKRCKNPPWKPQSRHSKFKLDSVLLVVPLCIPSVVDVNWDELWSRRDPRRDPLVLLAPFGYCCWNVSLLNVL